MYTEAQLFSKLEKADAAKDTEAAKAIADEIRRVRASAQTAAPIAAQQRAPMTYDTPSPDGVRYDNQQPPEQPKTSLIDKAIGTGEAALTVATGATGGAAGTFVGTLKGLADAIRSGKYGTNEGADLVEKTAMDMASKFTYAPRTQSGQEQISAVGEAMSPLQALPSVQGELMAISNMARNTAPVIPAMKQQARQTPAIQFLEQKAAPVMEAVKPAVEAVKQAIPDVKNLTLIPNTKFKKKIAEDIKAGSTDKRLAKYILDGEERVKADPIAKESINQGFDPGVIASIKGASDADRMNMIKMVDKMQRGKQNSLYSVKNRPSDVPGDLLQNIVLFVKTKNREAGGQLDEVAKRLKGKKLEITEPVNNFMESIDDMGIYFDETGSPVYINSDIAGRNLRPLQNAVTDMIVRVNRLKKDGNPDAYQVHRLKHQIDEMVTFGKGGEKGLSGKTEGILKQLRRDLDTALDNQFDDYKNVNATYSDTVQSLNSFQDVAGMKMDLFGPNADKSIGVLLRGMMSNNKSRANLFDAVDSLESTAKKYGGTFNGDLTTQMLFADELDRVFGPVARTSLAGETAKGFKKGAETLVGNRTMTGAAIEAAGAGVEKLRGINEENAFKSINELLRRKK